MDSPPQAGLLSRSMLPNLLTTFPRFSKEDAIEQGLDYYYSEDAAEAVIEFFVRYLRHSKGRFAGKPFEPLQWQYDLLTTMFGHLRVADGKRRFRTSYISTAKKNGKSSLLAGVALYLTCADLEPGSEVYSVACDVSQASIVFRESALMVQASPELSQVLEINKTRRNIADVASSSFYRVLPGEGFRVEGINSHAILFDELHAQRDRRLYDSLKYAGASREQPLFIATTTAGYDRESICYEMYQHAKSVARDPTYDETFLPYICEPAEDVPWHSPEAWRAANPSMGITINEEAFESDYKEAAASLTKESAFRRYRVNQWVQQQNRFISMDKWDACALPPPEPLEGRECWAGLDLASTYDTSAFVAIFPDENGCYDVLCRFWIPEENAKEREIRDKVPYTAWLADPETGLTATPGNVTDYDFIRRDIVKFGETYNVKQILIDRWNATQLAVQLASDGFDVQGYSQGFASMSGPTAMLENLVVSGKLRHNGNKVLASMANAVNVKTDPAGNMRPVKPVRGSVQRIDGIVSLIMALGGFSKEKPETKANPQIFVL